MDLSRWGLRRISKIGDRYRNFREFLGDVLEGDRTLIAPETIEGATVETQFSVRDDLASLLASAELTQKLVPATSRKAGAPLVNAKRVDRVQLIFEALAPFFEAGFCLSKNGERLDSMFLFGRVFNATDADSLENVRLALPPLRSGQVVKGRVRPVLEVFGIESLTLLDDASSFAFTPVSGRVFLLICNRPHPWQILAIENAFETVSELLARSARNQAGRVPAEAAPRRT